MNKQPNPADADHGHHFAHEIATDEVNEPLWSRVRDGQLVIGADGEHLGRVEEKAERVFTFRAHHGLFHLDELYVPHFAVDRVEGEVVYLKWSKGQIVEGYQHYQDFHMPRRHEA